MYLQNNNQDGRKQWLRAESICRAFLFVAVLSLTIEIAQAKPRSNDVRPGMTVAEATTVAIRCIQAASRMKTKDIRLQDTLAFVGINDELRLDALKRHIVRNPNIGVASFDRPFRGYSLKFLLLNEQLSTVETKWTVAKLAQTIAEKAGIVRLTYGRAASIIASCRGNTAEIPATDRPADDPQLPANFLTCLLGKEKGVGSAGISDPTGREYYYEIVDPDAVRRGIYTTRWTYQDLIKHIADEAHIPRLLRAYGGN